MTKHTVTFTAEDGWLVAKCNCGWHHKWKPNDRINEGDYGIILAYGLTHSRDGKP